LQHILDAKLARMGCKPRPAQEYTRILFGDANTTIPTVWKALKG